MTHPPIRTRQQMRDAAARRKAQEGDHPLLVVAGVLGCIAGLVFIIYETWRFWA